MAIPVKDVHADSSVTTADMINMMNNFRTGTYGLPAMVESAALDSCAQWTAETMASIQATTHLAFLGYSGATARCAGFGFGGGKTIFVTENWAMHTAMTLDILAGYWSDSAHMLPATEAQYTYVGAGIASANGRTYYVLQAGAISGETAATSAANGGGSSSGGSTGSTAEATNDTSQFMQPVVTSTPSADGMIYHVVASGQTMFQIALAYGITLDYLMQENSLNANSTIYVGQKLTIKQAPTPTVTPTFTVTPIYPTRTPTIAEPTHTPLPLMTPTPTPQPSLAQELPPFDRQTFGFLLVILSAIGLAVLVFFTFLKPSKKPTPTAPAAAASEPAKPVTSAPTPAKAKVPTGAAKPVQTTAAKTAAQPAAVAKKTKAIESEVPVAKPSKKKAPKVAAEKTAAANPETAPAKKPRTAKKKTGD